MAFDLHPAGENANRCRENSLFCGKCLTMIPEKNLKISLEELSLKGQRIIARQSEISYVQALEQVQRLKKISKVNQELKKSRPNS